LKVYFIKRIIDFDSDEVLAKAEKMGEANAARLLQGYLDDVKVSASHLPWLANVSAACEVVTAQRGTHCDVAISSDNFQLQLHRRDTWMVSTAITAYLGVPELLACLDPRRQFACSSDHPTLRGPRDYYLACKPWCVPYRGSPRRNESVVDWAILTAVHSGDPHETWTLLQQHLVAFRSRIELPPAILLATRQQSAELLKILIEELGNLSDPTTGAHAFSRDLDPAKSKYNEWQLGFRSKYLKMAHETLNNLRIG
jgi:hypothetical protein